MSMNKRKSARNHATERIKLKEFKNIINLYSEVIFIVLLLKALGKICLCHFAPKRLNESQVKSMFRSTFLTEFQFLNSWELSGRPVGHLEKWWGRGGGEFLSILHEELFCIAHKYFSFYCIGFLTPVPISRQSLLFVCWTLIIPLSTPPSMIQLQKEKQKVLFSHQMPYILNDKGN